MYIIKKDGMYLIGYQNNGLSKLNDDGNREDVYTCIWSGSKNDAQVFENQSFAEVFAGMIGGEAVKVDVKEG